MDIDIDVDIDIYRTAELEKTSGVLGSPPDHISPLLSGEGTFLQLRII
jgi:hypothetical protein